MQNQTKDVPIQQIQVAWSAHENVKCKVGNGTRRCSNSTNTGCVVST